MPLPLAVEDMFSMEEFLSAEQAKELVRFSTAGSVDDGKSTLIGRLLYDSQNVYEDHVRAVTRTTNGNAAAAIDFAQLTDGLRAEREQGITIDVAYRYFSTTHRKFIIADTPGHEQYTRNMATGASTADVAIILVDARKGILVQSRRHAYIASLLGTRHIVAAINKMDLVDYSSEVFHLLTRDLQNLAGKLGISGLVTIPVSALHGDNVVDRGLSMPWYEGPTLLEYLETVPIGQDVQTGPFRLPIQRVIRPFDDQHYRGFAGQIASGSIWPGDRVIALPSGATSRVKSITTFDGDLARAVAPMSIAVTLEDELDISRGDMLAAAHQPPSVATSFLAALVWMDAQPLDPATTYLLKHTSQTVKAQVKKINHRVNMQTLDHEPAATLELNSIGVVEIETTRPLFLDPYAAQRRTGSFILIDPVSHATVAAGMVREVLSGGQSKKNTAAIVIKGPALLNQVEAALRQDGVEVVRTRTTNRNLIHQLLQIGVVVLLESDGLSEFELGLPEEPTAAVAHILSVLRGSNQ
jgi:sulfate adenylyltransferase large subunit